MVLIHVVIIKHKNDEYLSGDITFGGIRGLRCIHLTLRSIGGAPGAGLPGNDALKPKRLGFRVSQYCCW